VKKRIGGKDRVVEVGMNDVASLTRYGLLEGERKGAAPKQIRSRGLSLGMIRAAMPTE